MKKTLRVSVIALLLLLGLASPTFAAAEKQFALMGSLEASETSEGGFPIIYNDVRSTGQASHLGRYTGEFEVALHIPSLTATVSGTLTAADGSSLFVEGVGQATLMGTMVSIVETLSIAGGTDRFAGANGEVTIERVLDRTTHRSSGTISGTIVVP